MTATAVDVANVVTLSEFVDNRTVVVTDTADGSGVIAVDGDASHDPIFDGEFGQDS